LITFLEDQRGTSLEMSHIILAAMGIAAIIGRLIWGKIARKITVYRTLLLIIPVSAILIFIAPLSKIEAINVMLFFVTMIFVSGVNPLFLSAAAIYPKSHSSSAYTILFIFMSLGGMSIPFGIGQVFQHFGPVVGMSSISLMFVIVLAMLLIVKKEIPVSEHLHRNTLY
jgi:predicted MFS family arabinose efflux permease